MALNIIPNIGQNLAETRDPIRNNFQFINDGFAINHVEFNSGGADTGKHKFVTMPVQGSDPATNASEMALYTKIANAVPALFIRYPNSVTPTNLSTILNGQTNGYMRLPNRLLVKWGQLTANGAATPAFPLGGGVPPFSAPPTMVMLTPIINPAALTAVQIVWNTGTTSATNLGVIATNGSGVAASVTFQFLAIGAEV